MSIDESGQAPGVVELDVGRLLDRDLLEVAAGGQAVPAHLYAAPLRLGGARGGEDIDRAQTWRYNSLIRMLRNCTTSVWDCSPIYPSARFRV